MKYDLGWDDVDYIRKEVGLPIIVRSILSAEQALEAERHGAAALGRPLLYGSALGGPLGAQGVHAHLNKELTMAMTRAGTSAIKDITRNLLDEHAMFGVI